MGTKMFRPIVNKGLTHRKNPHPFHSFFSRPSENIVLRKTLQALEFSSSSFFQMLEKLVVCKNDPILAGLIFLLSTLSWENPSLSLLESI